MRGGGSEDDQTTLVCEGFCCSQQEMCSCHGDDGELSALKLFLFSKNQECVCSQRTTSGSVPHPALRLAHPVA